MLEVNIGTVCRMIELAREFHAQQHVEIDQEPAAVYEDFTGEELEAWEDDPFLEEFRSVLNELNPDEQQQVVVLMWLGRGDYEIDEWEGLLEYAEEAWTEETADYLIAHPLLAEHLEAGLEQHGLSCED